AQGIALRKRAPLARLALVVVLIQAEADQLIFVDGVGNAGELRDGRPPQTGDAVEGGVELHDLRRFDGPDILGREVEGFVIEVATQPHARALVDVYILSQHAKKSLRLVHHARKLLQRDAG